MTAEEAAVLADADVTTIRRRCRDGSLPSLKLGKSWLIDATTAKLGSIQPRSTKGRDVMRRKGRNA